MALLKEQEVRGVTGPGSVFDTIVDFLTGDPLTPGRDWIIHADYRTLAAPYTDSKIVLRNTGKSDNENIYIGIWASYQSAGIEAGLVLKTYYHFDNSLVYDGNGVQNFYTSFTDTFFGNGNGYYSTGSMYCKCFMPFKTDESSATKPPLTLWVFSNKARVVLVINTEERYSNGYMGQYIRYVTPEEVPYPLVCLADSFNSGASNNDLWSIYLGYTVVDWSGGNSWNYHRRNLPWSRHGGNSWLTSSADTYRHFACNRLLISTGWTFDWIMDPTYYCGSTDINVNYPDGGQEQLLFPCILGAYGPAQATYDSYGQLDGVYWAPNQSNTTLSEIGEDGDCIIFPDINRTFWYSWMAIKDTL